MVELCFHRLMRLSSLVPIDKQNRPAELHCTLLAPSRITYNAKLYPPPPPARAIMEHYIVLAVHVATARIQHSLNRIVDAAYWASRSRHITSTPLCLLGQGPASSGLRRTVSQAATLKTTVLANQTCNNQKYCRQRNEGHWDWRKRGILLICQPVILNTCRKRVFLTIVNIYFDVCRSQVILFMGKLTSLGTFSARLISMICWQIRLGTCWTRLILMMSWQISLRTCWITLILMKSWK
jgi:hypothetical protein